MPRSVMLALLAVGILAFLAISALLARAFSAEGAERSAVTALIQTEARGDGAGVVRRITGCQQSAACQARVAADVARLRRAAPVTIIQIQTSTGFSLTGSVGTARVAWSAGSPRPIVQCVRVRRAGNVVRGLTVQLLELSAEIKSDAACPARY